MLGQQFYHETIIEVIVAGGTTFNYGGAGQYPGTVFSMSDAGSDQAHENRPPYYALCYIMKT